MLNMIAFGLVCIALGYLLNCRGMNLTDTKRNLFLAVGYMAMIFNLFVLASS